MELTWRSHRLCLEKQSVWRVLWLCLIKLDVSASCGGGYTGKQCNTQIVAYQCFSDAQSLLSTCHVTLPLHRQILFNRVLYSHLAV